MISPDLPKLYQAEESLQEGRLTSLEQHKASSDSSSSNINSSTRIQSRLQALTEQASK